MPAPRVFIIRHGETEWSINGKHTGLSDIPLTSNGEKRIRATGRALVGDDRLIVPRTLAHIYVSPRRRAQHTLALLDLGCRDRLPYQTQSENTESQIRTEAKVEITEDIREWDYGDYEGVTSPEIRKLRASQGLDPRWDIWRDGCPGGESPKQIEERLDRLIADIRTKYHGPAMEETSGKENAPMDVLIVAHGHILRAFAMRWAGMALHEGPTFLLEAGGVGTLSYEHGSIDEPAILLGGGFVVDALEGK